MKKYHYNLERAEVLRWQDDRGKKFDIVSGIELPRLATAAQIEMFEKFNTMQTALSPKGSTFAERQDPLLRK